MKKLFSMIIVFVLLLSGCADFKEGYKRGYEGGVECIEGDCRNGQGTYTYKDGKKYVGEFKKGKYHGQGSFTWKSVEWAGDKYVGEWKKDEMHGQGTYIQADGGKFIGKWENGRKSSGVSTLADGTVIKFKNGRIYKSKKEKAAAEEEKRIAKLVAEEEKRIAKQEAREDEDIDKAKKTCEKIGYVPGTEKFSDCALKLLTERKKTGREGSTIILNTNMGGSENRNRLLRPYPLGCRSMGGNWGC